MNLKSLLIFFILIGETFAYPVANFFALESITSEKANVIKLAIELSESTPRLVTIPIKVSGTANSVEDHNLLDGLVYISPGEKRGIVSFQVFENATNDVDYETLDIELLAPQNTDLGVNRKHSLTIVDSSVNLPEVEFTKSAQLTREGEVVTITATLSESSAQMIVVPYSVSGTSSFPDDHDAISGSLIFLPGETQSIVNVTVANDTISDDGENLVLTMMGPISNAVPGLITSQEIILEIDCPTGYEKVQYNEVVGTSQDFCVAKYEMKNVAGVPTSQAAGAPWNNVSQNDAITHCSSLGSNYHLVNNEEWMTIARSIEANLDNYSTNTQAYNRGNAYVGGNPQAASTDDDPCFGTSGTCSDTQWNIQKRTLTLSNGSVVWDMAGNGWDWVNTIVTDKPSKVDAFVEVNAPFPTVGFPATSYKSLDETLNSSHGIGKFFGGTSTRGGVLRGGSTASTTTAGFYSAYIDNDPNYAGNSTVFRCVYSLNL